jgi:hypothetical protein
MGSAVGEQQLRAGLASFQPDAIRADQHAERPAPEIERFTVAIDPPHIAFIGIDEAGMVIRHADLERRIRIDCNVEQAHRMQRVCRSLDPKRFAGNNPQRSRRFATPSRYVQP